MFRSSHGSHRLYTPFPYTTVVRYGPDCCGVRGWPGRVLAGTLAAGAWDRDTCDPFDEHSGPADAPASKERPARHRTSEAELPWLAARRAWALHAGAGADAVGGGRAAEIVSASCRERVGR